jgi:tetrahydromethanopterin S-methyltransferase subunit F
MYIKKQQHANESKASNAYSNIGETDSEGVYDIKSSSELNGKSQSLNSGVMGSERWDVCKVC